MSDFEIVDGKLIKYTGKDDVVKIPDGVVEIGDNCFENSKIKNISSFVHYYSRPKPCGYLNYLSKFLRDYTYFEVLFISMT